MICGNCGDGLVSQSGICLGCGFRHIKTDMLSVVLAIVAIALNVIFCFFISIAIHSTEFISLGTMAETIVIILSYIIPFSIATDAIFIACKRRQTYKTTLGMVLGVACVVIIVIQVLFWIL